jgi:hypothetical protein
VRNQISFVLLTLTVLVGAHYAVLAQERTPASVCLDKTHGQDRAMCIVMIGAIRGFMSKGKDAFGYRACSPTLTDNNDLSDSHAVVDWIHEHPERQEEELGVVAAEVLQARHPCP